LFKESGEIIMANLGLYIGLGALVGGLMLALFLINERRKMAKRHLVLGKNKGQQGEVLLLHLYRILSRFILSKKSVHHIRSRIEILGHTNERVIRLRVIKLYLWVEGILLSIFIGIVLTNRQLSLIGLWIFILWILSETLVDFLVIRLKNKLLWQQIKFNELVRHKYYETRMIDEAIYEACDELGKDYYEIVLQGERMYDVLLSKDPEENMLAYYETAPNKYLKMFLNLAYITMEYGDTFVEGASIFMKNLHDLTSEIRIEQSKREQLNYALKSLNVIVLIPLLFITPIKNWASQYFMPLKLFYESQTGVILELVMVILILSAYVLLRKVQQFDEGVKTYKQSSQWEDQLYTSKLGWLVDKIKPKRSSSTYRKLKRQLKRIKSHLSVEELVVRQLVTMVIVIWVAMMLVLGLHYNEKKKILTMPTLPEHFLGGQLSEKELAKAEAITERDTHYLKQINRKTSLADLIKMIEDDGVEMTAAEAIGEQVRRKQIDFYGHYLKWWEILACLALGVLGFLVPRGLLKFKESVVRIDVEDEVAGMSAIILMLMHHERLSVMEILEWLEMYSEHFTKAFGDCLNNLSSGMTEALIELRGASDHTQYVRLIDGLILASKDITIQQAFDELETEKSYYIEKRKETNRRIVEKKINLGRMLGFIPLYGLIIIYMIIPMIVSSITDMGTYFDTLMIQ